MRLASLITLILTSLLVIQGCGESNARNFSNREDCHTFEKQKYKDKAKAAKSFCTKKKYNDQFFILIDLSIHSGAKRFFVWDFNKEEIVQSFLVSHGCCDDPWGGDSSKSNAITSNTSGSHCSSLGKYVLGERGYSNWGINVKYLMHGLEASNNNALSRQIVFHGWDMVTDYPVCPRGTAEGWGCPAISNTAMELMDKKIKGSKNRKILMWVIK